MKAAAQRPYLPPARREPLLPNAVRLEGSAAFFPRFDARVFGPAIAMFTANDAAAPFPLRHALNCFVDQLDELICDAFPLQKAS